MDDLSEKEGCEDVRGRSLAEDERERTAEADGTHRIAAGADNADERRFFIVGAPKCGTTALARWLGEHRQIYMSPLKEPHFFSTDLSYRPIRTQAAYDRLFRGVSDDHLAVGEASVTYLYSDAAVPNIVSAYPHAKIIVCVRNPVDMAYSLHGQQVFAVNEQILDFEDAWRAQERRAQGLDIVVTCREPRLLLYGAVCALGRQLERLYEHVPKDRVHVVFLDDIKASSRDVYRDCLTFLGVPDDGRSRFDVVNAASRRRWPRLQGAVQRLLAAKSRLGVPPLGTGFGRFVDRVNRRPMPRAPMAERMRRELVEYFEAEIDLLQRLTDRDLQHWKVA
jgi:hypothetical protein